MGYELCAKVFNGQGDMSVRAAANDVMKGFWSEWTEKPVLKSYQALLVIIFTLISFQDLGGSNF